MGAYVMDDYRRALLGDHDCFTDKCQEAHRMALSALRPVSREQVERIRGKWETTADAEEELKNFSCSSCGYLLCDVDTAVIMPGASAHHHHLPRSLRAGVRFSHQILRHRRRADP